MSVMEMSHRSPVYEEIIKDAEAKLRAVMSIPDNYKVLFLQGGASTQFAAVPLNLLNKNKKADYILSGQFSTKAYKEAQKYGDVVAAASSKDDNFSRIPETTRESFRPDADYVHICYNNTIYGTKFNYIPDTGDIPLVADMSSCISSEPVDVSRYGIIFAGAQKNMAPAGLTVVIMREDLAGRELPYIPLMMNYQTMIEKDSMYNTPPCWCIYMLGLTLDWAEEQGGVAAMEKAKALRSGMLYDCLDSSKLFVCPAEKASRSGMNVAFRSVSEELDAKFIKEATEAGFVNLKGHRKVGGMRASIYNAMPVEGVEKLCDFIRRFDRENG